MIYLDTSYLARCYFEDPGFERVRELAESDEVGCCVFGRVELTAVFHRKLREGQLASASLREVFRQFDADEAAGLWHWLGFPVAHVEACCRRIRRLPANLFVRAGDAIHLACAHEHGFKTLYSNDRHLLAAASAFGVKAVDVISG